MSRVVIDAVLDEFKEMYVDSALDDMQEAYAYGVSKINQIIGIAPDF